MLKDKRIVKGIAAFILSVTMLVYILLTADGFGIYKTDLLPTAICFSVIYGLSLAFFAVDKKTDYVNFLFFAMLTAALIYLRVSLLTIKSVDYNEFLSKWVFKMRNVSFFEAIALEVGDYNLPYMYFLAIISRFKCSDIILIKAFSCFFDVVCAYIVTKLVSIKTDRVQHHILAFVLTLAAPTVILNGAYWGQCDVIYTALCLASMYCAIKEKGWEAVILFTLAFSFKLQSIFIVPALIICLLTKKIKPIQLTAIPAVLVVTALPAIFAGRDIKSIMDIYSTQIEEYPSLVLNAPTVFQFVGNVEYATLKTFGIFLSGTVSLIFVYLIYNYRKQLKTCDYIDVFYISAVILPFFLPSMHDRYFFMADVLSIVVFMFDWRKWYVPVITIFASIVSYVYFLMHAFVLIEQKFTAFALLVAVILVIKSLLSRLSSEKAAYTTEISKLGANND